MKKLQTTPTNSEVSAKSFLGHEDSIDELAGPMDRQRIVDIDFQSAYTETDIGWYN